MDKVKYWIDIADYDFATAQDLMKSKRWLYVGFMCHQTIEKTLKAYWSATREDEPPYIHNLTRLSELSGLQGQMTPEQVVCLDVLTPMNIEARYPQYKKELSNKLNKETCKYILEQTKQLYTWILQKL